MISNKSPRAGDREKNSRIGPHTASLSVLGGVIAEDGSGLKRVVATPMNINPAMSRYVLCQPM